MIDHLLRIFVHKLKLADILWSKLRTMFFQLNNVVFGSCKL